MTIYASYSHPVFLSTPPHYITAAVFTAVALILLIGLATELIHALGPHRGGRS
jgi:hypothetical protein